MSPTPPPTEFAAGSPVRITGGNYAGHEGTVAKTPTGTGERAMVRVSSPTLDKEVTVRQTSVEMLADTLSGLSVSSVTQNLATPRRKPPPKATPPRAPASFSVPGSREAPSTGGMGDMVIERIRLRRRLDDVKEQSFLSDLFGERVKIIELPLPVPEGTEIPGRTIEWMGRTWELLIAEVEEDGKAGRFGPSMVYLMFYVAVSGDGLEPIGLRQQLERIAAFDDLDSTVRKTIARLLLLRSKGECVKMTADEFEWIDEPRSAKGEEMLDGCGFIPDEMLLSIADKMGKTTGALGALRDIIKAEGLPVNMNTRKGERGLRDIASDIDAARAEAMRKATDRRTPPAPAISAALTVVAAQVRVVGPRIGVGKGMLMRKPGICKIQLPPSMIKVGPSNSNDEDWVCLIIKNIFPSSGNVLISKVLAGKELTVSARKELEQLLDMHPKKDKRKPGMVMRLLSALGVLADVMKAYEKKPVEQASHAWVVGVADPLAMRAVAAGMVDGPAAKAEAAAAEATRAAAATATLPVGHIFVTGLVPTLQSSELRQVFITRSPCVHPSHGRVMPVVTERPEAMEVATWQWLLSLPFGAVLFSGGGEGPPLPMTVADGDLDGDLYFVCWDANLLSHIHPRDLETNTPSYPPLLHADKLPISRGDAWLSQVQDKLIDLSMVSDHKYVGKIYNAMVKRIEELDGDMDDDEVVALGKAYTQGLVRDKHGCPIELPGHLHKMFG